MMVIVLWDIEAGFEYGPLILLWVFLAAAAARAVALRRVTNGLPRVIDPRRLWARWLALNTGTAADMARTIVSVVLIVAGLILLGTAILGRRRLGL